MVCYERGLIGVRSAVGEDLAAAEEFEHGVFAEGTGLPGGDDGLEVLAGHSLNAEVVVELDEDVGFGEGEWGGLSGGRGLRGVPPIHPAQHLGERFADAAGNGGEDAVLTALAELDCLG